MRRIFLFFAIVVLLVFASCQKQQTKEERNAEVERQVQQRLAAEHQTEEQQRLAQRQSELDAREKARVTVMSGSRAKRRNRGPGVHIPMAIGSTLMPVGPGFQRRRLVGRPI